MCRATARGASHLAGDSGRESGDGARIEPAAAHGAMWSGSSPVIRQAFAWYLPDAGRWRWRPGLSGASPERGEPAAPENPRLRRMRAEELPSWRETAAKKSIVEFVAAVTDRDSPDFVPEPDRIAVFDNDGTLWTEQPLYAQLAFAIDRAAELGHHTSLEKLHAGGMAALMELVTLTTRASPPMSSTLVPELAGVGPASAVRAAISADGVPADAGAAQPAGSQRFLLLDLLGRRHRLHAVLGG